MQNTSNALIANTPEQIAFFQICSLRGRLKMEVAGMKGRGSLMKICRLHGFTGKDKKAMLAQVEERIAKVKEEKGWTPATR